MQLLGHDVESLATVLADFVHLATATGAYQTVGFNNPHDPRQGGWRIADGAFHRGLDCLQIRINLSAPLELGLFNPYQRDGKGLKSRLAIVQGLLLGAFAARGMVQFADQMLLAEGNLSAQ